MAAGAGGRGGEDRHGGPRAVSRDRRPRGRGAPLRQGARPPHRILCGGEPMTTRKDYLRGPRIDPRPITGKETVTELVDNAFLAYNAGRLAEGCRLFAERMLAEDVTVGMSLTGRPPRAFAPRTGDNPPPAGPRDPESTR